jgi:flagellar basal-body rod protein FlgF
MLDRFVFTAMTGAKHAMGQLANTSSNLANVQTPGFRELLSTFRSVPINGQSADSRAFMVESTSGSDFRQGTMITTANPLDLAIRDRGFFVLQREDGTEAYTRAGRLSVDAEGMIRTMNGGLLLGINGPIQIPQDAQAIEVTEDGTVSVRFGTQQEPVVIDQLRLVDPEPHSLFRASDGFFENRGIGSFAPSRAVRVSQGAYEGSNVNPAQAMVEMIQQNRMYDLNIRLIQTASQNSEKASGLMSLSRV